MPSSGFLLSLAPQAGQASILRQTEDQHRPYFDLCRLRRCEFHFSCQLPRPSLPPTITSLKDHRTQIRRGSVWSTASFTRYRANGVRRSCFSIDYAIHCSTTRPNRSAALLRDLTSEHRNHQGLLARTCVKEQENSRQHRSRCNWCHAMGLQMLTATEHVGAFINAWNYIVLHAHSVSPDLQRHAGGGKVDVLPNRLRREKSS